MRTNVKIGQTMSTHNPLYHNEAVDDHQFCQVKAKTVDKKQGH